MKSYLRARMALRKPKEAPAPEQPAGDDLMAKIRAALDAELVALKPPQPARKDALLRGFKRFE